MVALTVSSRLRAMSITFGLFVLLLFLFVVVTLFWVLEVMRGESKLRAFKLAEKNKLRTMDTQPVCFYFAASQWGIGIRHNEILPSDIVGPFLLNFRVIFTSVCIVNPTLL